MRRLQTCIGDNALFEKARTGFIETKPRLGLARGWRGTCHCRFLLRFHRRHADPFIRRLPAQMNIPLEHLGVLESLRYLYEGD